MDFGQLGLEVLQAMLPIITTVLTAFAVQGLRLLSKKFKLDIDLTNDAILRIAIRSAIGGAEEWAARELKLDGKSTIVSSDKVALVRGVIKAKYPDLTSEEFDTLLDEELAAMEGVGATEGAVE